MTQQQPAPPASSKVEVHRWPVPVDRDQHPPAASVLAWWRQRPPALRPMTTSPVAAAAEAGGRLLYRVLRALPAAGRHPHTAAVDHGSPGAGEPARW